LTYNKAAIFFVRFELVALANLKWDFSVIQLWAKYLPIYRFTHLLQWAAKLSQPFKLYARPHLL